MLEQRAAVLPIPNIKPLPTSLALDKSQITAPVGKKPTSTPPPLAPSAASKCAHSN